MGKALLLIGALATILALTIAPGDALSAVARSWPPFILVVGLLLVGVVANGDGMFDRAAGAISRLRGGGVLLFLTLLGLVAVVTAVLNLDTSVAFLTPIMVLSARRRGLSETPFLFGSLLMANASSLLLPGSNLTNLLVTARDHISGAAFAVGMLPAWIVAVSVTTAVLLVRYRKPLTQPAGESFDRGSPDRSGKLGIFATAGAAIAVVTLRSAAVPVLAIGIVAVGVRLVQRRLPMSDVTGTVDALVLAGLFGLATGLGTLAAVWSGPADLLMSAGRWESAAIGAIGAVVVNNLPAAVLFSARTPVHPRALLIGLDLGPNLAVSGSLSALIWFQAAKTVKARPSILTVTRIGIVLVPCSMIGALLVTRAN